MVAEFLTWTDPRPLTASEITGNHFRISGESSSDLWGVALPIRKLPSQLMKFSSGTFLREMR
jgi:hypothetical protein